VWNIEGLKRKLEISSFTEFVSSYDVIGLVETWAGQNDVFTFPGYTQFSKTRPKPAGAFRNSGGLLLLVRDHLASSCVIQTDYSATDNIIWMKVINTDMNNSPLFLALVYFTPVNSSVHSTEPVFDLLESDITQIKADHPGCHIVLMGDLNARTGNGSIHDFIDNDDISHLPIDDELNYIEDADFIARVSQDSVINKRGRQLLELCQQTGLRICNGRIGDDAGCGRITCTANEGKSVVDYVLATQHTFPYFHSFQVCDQVESSHMPVSFTFYSNFVYSDLDENLAPKHRFVWNDDFKNVYLCNWNGIPTTSLVDFYSQITNQNIDSAVSLFVNMMKTCASTCEKITRSRRHKATSKGDNWYDSECRAARATARSWLRAFHSSNSKHDRHQYDLTWKYYKDICSEKSNTSFNLFVDKVKTTLNTGDNKLFWSLFSRVTHMSNTITSQDWSRHFESLFQGMGDTEEYVDFYTSVDDFVQSLSDEHIDNSVDESSFMDSEITEHELLEAINNMKLGKAPGYCGLTLEFFKNAPPLCIEMLLKLYNVVLQTGIYPDQWTYGVILPIFKKGNSNKPENYRPITLLEVAGKIFAKVMCSRLALWADIEDKIAKEQAGFRKGFRTSDNIFILNTIIQKYISRKGGRLFCAFIDLKAAFDSVYRNGLLYKLWHGGVNGRLYKLIKNMYVKVQSCVSLDSGYTAFFECKYGLRQGCQMSPFLFSFFINDIVDFLNSDGQRGITIDMMELFILLFADDIVLFDFTPVGLQKRLDKMAIYCSKWKLKVNIDKSKIIVFRKGGPLRRGEKFSLNKQYLEMVSSYKYLGVHFSSSGSWYKTQKTLAQQAWKVVQILQSESFNLFKLPYNVLFRIFDVKIMPILLYGSEVWGFHPSPDVDLVHDRFCKLVLGLRRKSPNIVARGEVGRFSMKVFQYKKIITYWLRLLSQNTNIILKHSYNFQFKMAERGEKCWAFDVKSLLYKYGFGEVWLQQGVGNIELFTEQFLRRCKDIDIQTWNENTNAMSKLQFYKQVKIDYCLENYILYVQNMCYIKALSKFRCSSHTLMIEMGRMYNIDRNSRFCPFCIVLIIESEFHFCLECPFYASLRKSILPMYYCLNPSQQKLKMLFNSSHTSLLTSLGKYIFLALKKRDKYFKNISVI